MPKFERWLEAWQDEIAKPWGSLVTHRSICLDPFRSISVSIHVLCLAPFLTRRRARKPCAASNVGPKSAALASISAHQHSACCQRVWPQLT